MSGKIEWTTETRNYRQRDIARCKACKAAHTRLWTITRTETYRSDKIGYVGRPNERFDAVETGPEECCGRRLSYKPVKGRRNAEIPCNAKCTSSKGWVCECSCGGKNHGAGHAGHFHGA